METQFEKRQLVLIQVALSGIMAALVAVATAIVQIPVPATKGYLNFGDIMIFVSALTLGPIVGGLAGSIGSAISDIVTGYGPFAPFTFIIKGTEGVIAGLISNKTSRSRDVLAVTVAGIEMITGYFLAEFYPIGLGWDALAEIPVNFTQILVGGLVGLPIALIIRRRLPEIMKYRV